MPNIIALLCKQLQSIGLWTSSRTLGVVNFLAFFHYFSFHLFSSLVSFIIDNYSFMNLSHYFPTRIVSAGTSNSCRSKSCTPLPNDSSKLRSCSRSDKVQMSTMLLSFWTKTRDRPNPPQCGHWLSAVLFLMKVGTRVVTWRWPFASASGFCR